MDAKVGMGGRGAEGSGGEGVDWMFGWVGGAGLNRVGRGNIG